MSPSTSLAIDAVLDGHLRAVVVGDDGFIHKQHLL